MKLISFSGLDGSGKTTQVKLFVNYLKKKNRPYKVVHMIRNSIGNRLLNGLGETEKRKTSQEQKLAAGGCFFEN
ncbi:hypothetical protein KJ912_03995 [Patescibacteria group bacterium]|nr:hypothetical protein [Patescibacteria group bacterium]